MYPAQLDGPNRPLFYIVLQTNRIFPSFPIDVYSPNGFLMPLTGTDSSSLLVPFLRRHFFPSFLILRSLFLLLQEPRCRRGYSIPFPCIKPSKSSNRRKFIAGYFNSERLWLRSGERERGREGKGCATRGKKCPREEK